MRIDELLRIFFSKHQPVLLCGPTGTGKTLTAEQHLARLDPTEFLNISINFTARSSSTTTQVTIESRLDRRRKGVLGPPFGITRSSSSTT